MKNTRARVVYDGDGNRVRKTVSGVTTHYLVSTMNPSGYAQVVEELTVSGGATNLSRVYAYGRDLISQRDSSSNVTFYGYDGNGNTRYLTATNGTITDTYVYDAFGIQIASSGSTSNIYLYSGEQYDSSMGFYYLRARYLNAAIGRFWTREPLERTISDPSTLHRYLYCLNNPINRIDPLGQSDTGTLGGTIVIGGGYATIGSFQLPAISMAYVKAAATVAVLAATLAGDRSDRGVLLYRGVPRVENDKYTFALQGIAKPRGIRLDQDALTRHVLGEDVDSGVTSWTGLRPVAFRFSGPDGIILEVRVESVLDRIVPRPTIAKYGAEQEVLLRGIIVARPTKP